MTAENISNWRIVWFDVTVGIPLLLRQSGFWQTRLYPASSEMVLPPHVGQNRYRSCQASIDLACPAMAASARESCMKPKGNGSLTASTCNLFTWSSSNGPTSTANQPTVLSVADPESSCPDLYSQDNNRWIIF